MTWTQIPIVKTGMRTLPTLMTTERSGWRDRRAAPQTQDQVQPASVPARKKKQLNKSEKKLLINTICHDTLVVYILVLVQKLIHFNVFQERSLFMQDLSRRSEDDSVYTKAYSAIRECKYYASASFIVMVRSHAVLGTNLMRDVNIPLLSYADF